MIKRCKRCTLPHNFPGIRFSEEGVCHYCQKFDLVRYEQGVIKASEELTNLLENESDQAEKKRNFDCIVALSGGKDSCYTLKILVERFGLRCLAITVDNGFLSQQSIRNSQLICDSLGVDFIVFRPSFKVFKRLYSSGLAGENVNRSAIIRASDLCTSCINLINTIMLKEALQRNIPVIAGGYIAGQVPEGSCVLKMHLNTLRKFSEVKSQQQKITAKYQVSEEDLESYTIGDYVNIVNPLLAQKYDQQVILSELEAMGWSRPDDTGQHSSNCKINDLGILNHQKRYGFHPYEMEIAEQVRTGTLARTVGISKIEAELDLIRVTQVEKVVRS